MVVSIKSFDTILLSVIISYTTSKELAKSRLLHHYRVASNTRSWRPRLLPGQGTAIMIIGNGDLWVCTFSLASFAKHRHFNTYSSRIEDHGFAAHEWYYETILIYLPVHRGVEISPSSVAPVCQAGDQLELTCESSGTIHRWELVHCST